MQFTGTYVISPNLACALAKVTVSSIVLCWSLRHQDGDENLTSLNYPRDLCDPP